MPTKQIVLDAKNKSGFVKLLNVLAVTFVFSSFNAFKNINFNKNKNMFMISAILIAAIGGLLIQTLFLMSSGTGAVYAKTQITSIAFALILGIMILMVYNAIRKRNSPEESAEDIV